MYPPVLGEIETLALVCQGRSIARYGDGEIKMAYEGTGIKSQMASPSLTRRLLQILETPGQCLIGIPNVAAPSPKVDHWSKFGRRYGRRLPGRVDFVSSFITRPDSAPWLDTPDCWAMVESLWKGLDVTLVRGKGKSFVAERLMEAGARSVTEVMAPEQHAWSAYDSLLQRIGRPKRALLCLGPTATVMAVDLCAKGVHAIDAGHLGMFWKRHLLGQPMWEPKPEPEFTEAEVLHRV